MTYPDFSRKLAIAAAWLACGAGAICAAQSPAPVPQGPAKIWKFEYETGCEGPTGYHSLPVDE